MAADIPLTLRCLDSAGVLVLDATEAAGYEVVSLEPLDRSWRRSRVTSDDVEGHVEVQAVLDTATIGLVVRVRGGTAAEANTRRTNLINAVEARKWRLEIGIDGVLETWTADRADTSTRRDWMDVHHTFREVSIRVPVQPRPAEGP